MNFYSRLVWLLCVAVTLKKVQSSIIKYDLEVRDEPTENKISKRIDGDLPPENYLLDTAGRNSKVMEALRCRTEVTAKLPGYHASVAPKHCFSKNVKANISYRVVIGPQIGMSKSLVEGLTARALAAWAPYCRLHFTRRNHGPADIMISFEQGDHGDTDPFKPQEEVTAHTFCVPYPYRCLVHLNEADDDALVQTRRLLDGMQDIQYNIYIQ